MTLDRTKKYKVGRLVFKYDPETDTWESRDSDLTYLYTVSEALLELMHPVEVEEPIKWGFESDGDFPGDVVSVAPTRFAKGNWRHEVVSTRIG